VKVPEHRCGPCGEKVFVGRAEPNKMWRAWFLAGVALLNIGALYFLLIGSRARKPDFIIYFVWAWALRHGASPYVAENLKLVGHTLGVPYLVANYPPLFILLFEPMTLLDPVTALWLWQGLNILLLAACLLLLSREFRGRPSDLVIASSLALLYGPLSVNLFWAQTQVPLLLLLILALRWSRLRKDWICGAALAMAGLIKIYPIFVLGYFIILRRWRVVVSGLLLGVSAILASIALLGLEPNVQFLHHVGYLGLEIPTAISLLAIISRTFSLFVNGRPDATLTLASVATTWVVIVGFLFLTVRATVVAAHRGREEAAYGLWVVAAVLLCPISWVHHMVLLLIPFAQLLDSRSNRRALKLGAYSYWLAEVGLGLFWLRELAHPSSSFLVAMFPLVFLLSLLLTFGSTYFNTVHAPDANAVGRPR
jgi:alpha-1,2-mannosyltransferase